MEIKKVVLRKMRQKLVCEFRTSFASMNDKAFGMIELYTKDGLVGYGDCSALDHPWYNEETRDGSFSVIERYLIPALFENGDIGHPSEFFDNTSWIRRNRMARSAVDCALWDIYAQEQGVSLATALGGMRKTIEVGVSIGIQSSPTVLCQVIKHHLSEGYRRIKCKIKPEKDIAYLDMVRQQFPEISLMVDANSAYTLSDLSRLKALDDYNLLMIEQPLDHDDIVDHRFVQQELRTPICLDESILSAEDARKAIELGSCKVINIKVARVGGLTEAKRIHDICKEAGIPVWCGGMLDTGIARAFNIAIASLPNYCLPHDIPSWNRYWKEDLVMPHVTLKNGPYIQVPQEVGRGFSPVPEIIDKYTEYKIEFVK